MACCGKPGGIIIIHARLDAARAVPFQKVFSRPQSSRTLPLPAPGTQRHRVDAHPLGQRRPQPSLVQPLVCSSSSGSSSGPAPEGGNSSSLVATGGLFALYAGLLAYVFLLAPNQTPTIDEFVVLKLVGQKPDDAFQVNKVFEAVWNCMGLYPLIYAALLIPGARSNRVPAWPFVSASVFLGAYALIPYMALWSPKTPAQQLPPPPEELDGWNKLYMKGAETVFVPALLAAAAAYWVAQGATAPSAAWSDYLRLFDQSRLVHATSVDFALCTLLAPFWMYNDAAGRGWARRDQLVPLLSFVPLLGPAIYLLLRPKTYGSIGGSPDSSTGA